MTLWGHSLTIRPALSYLATSNGKHCRIISLQQLTRRLLIFCWPWQWNTTSFCLDWTSTVRSSQLILTNRYMSLSPRGFQPSTALDAFGNSKRHCMDSSGHRALSSIPCLLICCQRAISDPPTIRAYSSYGPRQLK